MRTVKKNSLYIGFLLLIAGNYAPATYSQIIGSSVVTSVSIIQGNENQDDLSTTTLNPIAKLIAKHRKAEPAKGVLNVIATLKNIVEEEQLKLGKQERIDEEDPPASNAATTNPVQSADESPPTSQTHSDSTLEEDVDDENEGTSVTPDPGPSDLINDFAKVVVSVQPVENDPSENDTATSAEVNEAIHQISGALLSPNADEDVKPIENIVTDVLSSIIVARNATQTPAQPVTSVTVPVTTTTSTTTTSAPKTSLLPILQFVPSVIPFLPSPTTTTATTTTTTSKQVTTTTLRPKPPQKTDKLDTVSAPAKQQTSKAPSPSPSVSPKPQLSRSPVIIDGESGTDAMLSTTKIPGIPVDENQTENSETEEQADDINDDPEEQEPEQEVTTVRPHIRKPTKSAMHYFVSKKPLNTTTNSNRPTDFYDDEIFGYDPYQTFLHGVYVPVVEVGSVPTQFEDHNHDGFFEDDEPLPTTMASKRPKPRPNHSSGHLQRPGPSSFTHRTRPIVKTSNPVRTNPSSYPTRNPNTVRPLPDHLHRPRPSHIQYQHGAAEDVEQDTGLLKAKYKHPGSNYDEETITPDKLLPVARPLLPAPVRRNLTEHHDHHHQHQLGHGSGHGHGHHEHGSHGHESVHGHSDTAGHGEHGAHGAHGAHGDHHDHAHHGHDHHQGPAEKRPNFGPAPQGNPGLEATLTNVDPEMRSFVDINNRLALRLFSSVTNPVSKSSTVYKNMVLSPFTVTSSLAMLFLGARGSTAAQLDGLLRLDDMLTFNPHMMYHNITQSFLTQPNTAAALIRLLIADKNKGDILDFYKTRVQHFYDARVEEADYKFAGHMAQSIINQMIRAQIQRHSYEMLNYSLPLSGPMSLLTSAFFDGQFAGARDSSIDNMNFIHLAALGRRLFQVPAMAIRGGLRAAYDSDLDATAVEVPYSSRDLSLILMMPGKPGEFAIGGVSALKSRLTLESWTSLMRGFYPRESFKVVFPRFRHQSALNLSYTLQRFGLSDMFQPHLAKYKGINGLTDLFLDQNMMHFSEFGTWEKLSDTLTETNIQNTKNTNLDLIRILRPHVREHYGNYGEPLSVNDWIFMSRTPAQKRSEDESIPDDWKVADIEHGVNNKDTYVHSKSYTNPRVHPPFLSYSKVRSTKSELKPDSSHHGAKIPRRQTRSKSYLFRQEPTSTGEEKVLRFERPFLYLLRHNPTGMILMTGQYTEPVTEVLS